MVNSPITTTRIVTRNRLHDFQINHSFHATTKTYKRADSLMEQILRHIADYQITTITNPKATLAIPSARKQREQYIWATDASTDPKIHTHTASASILIPPNFSMVTKTPAPTILTHCLGRQGTLHPSNNLGELHGIFIAIQHTPLDANCHTVTDSQINIDRIKGVCHGMTPAQWMKMECRPLLANIKALIDQRDRTGAKTTFEHVHSHNSITSWQEYWNDVADRHAKIAYAIGQYRDNRIPPGSPEILFVDQHQRYIDGSIDKYLAHRSQIDHFKNMVDVERLQSATGKTTQISKLIKAAATTPHSLTRTKTNIWMRPTHILMRTRAYTYKR